MGRIRGQAHTKARKYLSAEERELIFARNAGAHARGEFLTQQALAAEFGVTQRTISMVLRAAGAKTRSPVEASPSRLPVREAALMYQDDPSLTLRDVAKHYGCSASALRCQFVRAGVSLRRSKDYAHYTQCNREFFDVVDPLRAYYAGFLAADGYVTISGRAVVLGLHPKDVEVLERLKSAARMDQPIVSRVNNQGRLYVWLTVCSTDWVRALALHYNVVNAKSLTLKPPPFDDPALVWPFVRGYFDGNGHASIRGTVALTSGSPEFIAWLQHWLGPPGSTQVHRWQTPEQVSYVSATTLVYTSQAEAARVARCLYTGSDETTRLARKYHRLRHHLVSE